MERIILETKLFSEELFKLVFPLSDEISQNYSTLNTADTLKYLVSMVPFTRRQSIVVALMLIAVYFIVLPLVCCVLRFAIWVVVSPITYLYRSVTSKRSKDNKTIQRVKQGMAQQICDLSDKKFMRTLPKDGWKEKPITKRLLNFSQEDSASNADIKYSSGGPLAANWSFRKLCSEISGEYMYTDLNDIKSNPRAKQIEMEVVSMVLMMFKASSECGGFTTQGGAQSILLSLYAHKRQFKKINNLQNGARLEIVLPETANAAFFKACSILDITPIVAPVNPQTLIVDSSQINKLVSSNTIAIVASCPNMGTGEVDPLADLNTIAGRRGVGLILDCTLGGFLVPFCEAEQISLSEKIMDFRLENVTSIISNPDQYGLAPKGCSVLMFSDADLQKEAYFGKLDWSCDNFYGSNGTGDSQSASMAVSAWVMMLSKGKVGFQKQLKFLNAATLDFAEAIDDIAGLEIIGDPQLGTVAFRASNESTISILSLGNLLYSKGWRLDYSQKYQFLKLKIHSNNIEELKGLKKLLESSAQSVSFFTS